MSKRIGIYILLLFTALPVCAAEIVSTLADQEEVAVTIYNDDLALVRDRRQVTLSNGELSLALREVSARIRPETALLRSLSRTKGLTVLEQNFDFDLLTPGKLLEKYVGKEVQVVRTHPQTGADQAEKAQVLAANEGIVLKVGDRIETGLPGRLIFPAVPANLRDRPTLVVDLTDYGYQYAGIRPLDADSVHIRTYHFVLPFHQMGRFKWKELGLSYRLEDTAPPSAEVVERTCAAFRNAGLKAY